MKFERELLKGVAPLAVLGVLSNGAMYGYELSKAVEERSGKILNLGYGTLYPLLYNLEAKGFVIAEWQEAENGRKRRYYSITGKGRKHLERQKAQLDELQKAIGMVLTLEMT